MCSCTILFDDNCLAAAANASVSTLPLLAAVDDNDSNALDVEIRTVYYYHPSLAELYTIILFEHILLITATGAATPVGISTSPLLAAATAADGTDDMRIFLLRYNIMCYNNQSSSLGYHKVEPHRRVPHSVPRSCVGYEDGYTGSSSSNPRYCATGPTT